MSIIKLSIFERTIHVRCNEHVLRNMLLSVYGDMQIEGGLENAADLEYEIYYSNAADKKICIQRNGQTPEYAEDDSYFIYLFEKDMTISLERMRQDLYFLHAAALEYNGKIHLLVAESGAGKSTTSWALLHHGFRYSSDELAPVRMDTMEVLSYTHAICLKAEPPPPYGLPDETLRTERTLHVPIHALPSATVAGPVSLGSIFFVKYQPHLTAPSIRAVSSAHAGARVYANGLNQLAHPSDGLDAALKIAQHCQCYELQSADLTKTCLLLKNSLDSQ